MVASNSLLYRSPLIPFGNGLVSGHSVHIPPTICTIILCYSNLPKSVNIRLWVLFYEKIVKNNQKIVRKFDGILNYTRLRLQTQARSDKISRKGMRKDDFTLEVQYFIVQLVVCVFTLPGRLQKESEESFWFRFLSWIKHTR